MLNLSFTSPSIVSSIVWLVILTSTLSPTICFGQQSDTSDIGIIDVFRVQPLTEPEFTSTTMYIPSKGSYIMELSTELYIDSVTVDIALVNMGESLKIFTFIEGNFVEIPQLPVNPQQCYVFRRATFVKVQYSGDCPINLLFYFVVGCNHTGKQ